MPSSDLIPAGVLADLRTLTNRSLPSTAVIARTSASVPCRVNDATAGTHIPGVPHYMHLRQWTLTLPDGTDALAWDILTVSGRFAGDYLVTAISSPTSLSASTVLRAVQLGTTVAAHTLREPDPLLPGQVAAFGTSLTSLKLRPIMGVLIMPISPQSAFDALGIQIQQPAMILAEWPAGYTGLNPIIPRDVLVLDVGGTEYQVSGCRPYQGRLIEVYIDLAQEVGS